MGWHCVSDGCDWTAAGDSLAPVVRHEIENEGHEAAPDVDTALSWMRAGLG